MDMFIYFGIGCLLWGMASYLVIANEEDGEYVSLSVIVFSCFFFLFIWPVIIIFCIGYFGTHLLIRVLFNKKEKK